MFYPKKKKKLGDLEVDEVIEALGLPKKIDLTPDNFTRLPDERPVGDGAGIGEAANFYPQTDTTNYGQGRTIEDDLTANQNELAEQNIPAETSFYPKSAKPVSNREALEAEYEKRRELQTTGAKKEKSLAKRLLFGALRGAGAGQGIGGMLGGAVTGAAVEGFYPKANTKIRTEQQLAESNRNIGNLQQAEKFEAAQQQERAQTDLYNTQRKEIERKPAKEQEDREFKLVQEAQKQANRLAKIAEERRLKGLDTKFGTAKDGSGRVVIVDGNGRETFVTNADGSFEYNELEKPVEQTLSDGRKVFMKGNQAYSAEAQKELAKAQMQWSETKFNAENDEEFNEQSRKWETDVTTAGGEVSRIDNELAGLLTSEATTKERTGQVEAEITDIQEQITMLQGSVNPSPITDAERASNAAIESKISAKQSQLNAKRSELAKINDDIAKLGSTIQAKKGEKSKALQTWEGLKKNKPVKSAKVTAPVVGGGKYAGQVFPSPSALKSAFPNKTEAEIKQIIEAHGGRFQN